MPVAGSGAAVGCAGVAGWIFCGEGFGSSCSIGAGFRGGGPDGLRGEGPALGSTFFGPAEGGGCSPGSGGNFGGPHKANVRAKANETAVGTFGRL